MHPVSKLALIGFLLTTPTICFAQQTYRVLEEWKIGGEGSWDYLVADSAAHRLYVTHNSRVEVVNTLTGKLAGAITGLKSTHGVALDPDGRIGYISDGAGNAVVLFDRRDLSKSATIPVGTNPDAILFEPSTRTVWAFNGRSKDVSVIDPQKRSVIATVPLPGKPEFAQADGKGNVFVNIEDENSIVHLDAASRSIVATWPMKGCESPSGLAMDLQHNRLFAVCDGKKMAVVDTSSGHEIALANIGDGPDAAAYDAKDQLAFSSNGDGTLTVVDTKNGYKALQTLNTRRGARTLAYDSATDRIYMATAEYGSKPAATASNPRPKATVVPGSFTILVVGRN